MKKLTVICAALALAGCSHDGADELVAAETMPVEEPTVMSLMVEDITNDSNIVWGIEEPQTDEEWQVFDDAAARLVEAFQKVEHGLAGPNDEAWAEDAAFRAYIEQEYAALEQMREAIAARDIDGVFDAGGELYTPCEECHLEFNPAVADQQQY